jgi:hypothetical protein
MGKGWGGSTVTPEWGASVVCPLEEAAFFSFAACKASKRLSVGSFEGGFPSAPIDSILSEKTERYSCSKKGP